MTADLQFHVQFCWHVTEPDVFESIVYSIQCIHLEALTFGVALESVISDMTT